ncbi:MAG: putative sulfate exporter family transporter [Sphingorhabdus sp.]
MGFSACASIAAGSIVVANATGVPAVLLALIAGTVIAHRFDVTPIAGGINFSVRTVLRIGIALIGARLSMAQISALGLSTALVSVGGVLLMLSVGTLVAVAFGLPRNRSLLSAGAVGICGASAALAISTVLPQHDEHERQTVTTVATVTALSTIAMLLYPLISRFLGLNDLEAGVFFGASIHDVTQVAGAGAMVSPMAATAAIATKLVRVSCLAPVVATIIVVFARRGGPAGEKSGPPVPIFLVAFAAVALAANLGLIAQPLRMLFSDAATFCLVAATVALGMKTSIHQIFLEGWRPLAAMSAQTLLLATYVLACITLFRL